MAEVKAKRACVQSGQQPPNLIQPDRSPAALARHPLGAG
jgi:hypothetical protein